MRGMMVLASLGYVAFIGLTIWMNLHDMAAFCHYDAACIARGMVLRGDLTAWLPIMVMALVVTVWIAATGVEEEA